MGRKAFQAEMWLMKNNASNEHARRALYGQSSGIPSLPTFKDNIPPLPKETTDGFAPANCFVPGWSGDSLVSKHIQKFKIKLNKVHQDSKEKFLLHNNFNRSLKINIFQEFIDFLEHKAINSVHIDDYQVFWTELDNSMSPHREVIDQFIDIYSFRVSTIYMLKLRFIKHLQDQISPDFDLKYAFYPSSFLTSLFRRGSSFELKSKALESNIYSWYRPSDYLSKDITELCDYITQISIAELVKVISISFYDLVNQSAPFSHALSHKNFGLFLNSLLINFPLWLDTSRKEEHYYKTLEKMEVVSCKFDGDYLESLSLSHWLAQQTNREIKWEQILCPDFKGQEFESGLFLKICNELQLLTILIDIAKSQHRPVIQFLCETMNGHLQNKKDSIQAQKTLCLNDLSLNKSTYDRIVLNINKYPKNNSQHYLIGQIQNQLETLKENGMLFVISSKKLFVPSQKSKVDSLLEKLKVEAIFDLSEIKGKGEVGNYIYIFSKPIDGGRFHNPISAKKQSCYTFRFSGELPTFQLFSEYTDLLHTFFINHLKEIIPMYQKETDQGLRFEFFQDAIVDGRLMHSSSKDSSKITHPHFFKSLMRSYLPLDYFFDVQNIDNENKEDLDEPPLFPLGDFDHFSSYPYVLIVDKRLNNNPKLEIISQRALEAKSYEYGHTQCYYFGIRPKWPNICLDSLQDFFLTKIGKQIIDLTFSSENRKIKARLSKMLIPKFFSNSEEIPSHIEQAIQLLYSEEDALMDMHPQELRANFDQILQFVSTLSTSYPATILSRLSRFKRSIKNCLDTYGAYQKNGKINFNNPMLRTPLVLSKTLPIYPNNPDVYVEFKHDNANMLHNPLTSYKSFHQVNNGVESFGINLLSENNIVLVIYSDKDMISFLDFLLSKVIGTSIASLVQGIAVPRLEDLKSIIKGFNLMNESLTHLHDSVDPLIDQITNHSSFQS